MFGSVKSCVGWGFQISPQVRDLGLSGQFAVQGGKYLPRVLLLQVEFVSRFRGEHLEEQKLVRFPLDAGWGRRLRSPALRA